MERRTTSRRMNRKPVAVCAMLALLISSTGCMTANMWSWATQPIPVQRASGHAGGYAPVEYRVSGGRVFAAIIFTPFILCGDIFAAAMGMANDGYGGRRSFHYQAPYRLK